ncbi:MAG: glutathione S-transferase N-terminal domain-containing protein [Beijerinckiaceae bacterium]|jgi:glutathione S-transferase|nr:glutathione S-transferase N-terminal domain-containing protein [Beijerinckiaceae bacterium]
MTKLFYSPGSCALGIHVLLEEVGQPYELAKVDLMARQQYEPAFVAVNPKSKVPALVRDDGSVLTEWPAIATWLALTNPGRKLLPTDPEALVRTLESVDYVVATLHMQGFTRVWRPDHFTPTEADYPVVKKKGHEIVEKGLAAFEEKLEGRDYLGGADMSIADAALFYFEFWIDSRLKQAMPKNLAAHYQRMRARPAVAKVLKDEGFA